MLVVRGGRADDAGRADCVGVAMTVLDLSNYDADTLDVACMKANGVTGVILGCQRPLVARDMANTLQAGGIPIIGVYAFLYLGIDSTGQTGNAIDIAHEYGVRRVWLDVESTGASERAGITPAERIAEVANCVAQVRNAGLDPGIYTGRWYWVPQMANTDAFSDLPLWHSEYPADGHEVRTVDYGGWTNVAVHQYTSTLPVCGRNRDANYVFEEDEMTEAEFAERFAKLMGQMFPAYLRLAFEEVDGNFSDRPDIPMTFPYKPWLIGANQTIIPEVARD